MSKSFKILVAHGVNLDLLGQREPEHYGHATLDGINQALEHYAQQSAQRLGLQKNVELTFFQTNQESEYLEKLDQGWDGALLNPGAWTHTSLALADRLAALQLKFVEVHMSSISCRESYRHESYCSRHALGMVQGFGQDSYKLGLWSLLEYLQQQNS